MLYLLDTYGWIEYFLGSQKGKNVRKLLIKQDNVFITVESSLAEINGWCLKNNQDFEKCFRAIRANSTVVLVNQNDWIDAGKERFNQRLSQPDFGLIDAILLIKQKAFNCKLITGDRHFEKLKHVIFLK